LSNNINNIINPQMESKTELKKRKSNIVLDGYKLAQQNNKQRNISPPHTTEFIQQTQTMN